MKNLLKLPVLLLAVILVASCSDSKKKEEKKLSPVEQAEAYGVKMAELECELMIAYELEDQDKMDEIDLKMEKVKPEAEEKMKGWGEDSDEGKAAEAAFNKEMESCQEKITEAVEKAKQERITELVDMAKKLAKLQCELEKEYSTEVEEEVLEINDSLREMIFDDSTGKAFASSSEVMEEVDEAYEIAKRNCNANPFNSDIPNEAKADMQAEVMESPRSMASKDAEEAAKLFCEMMAAMIDDPDVANNMQSDEFFKNLDRIYGPSGSASDEDKLKFQEEFQAAVEGCM